MSTKKNDRAEWVLRQAHPNIQREPPNPTHTHVILTFAAILLAGCGSTAIDTTGSSGDDAGLQVICGHGTQLVGNECQSGRALVTHRWVGHGDRASGTA